MNAKLLIIGMLFTVIINSKQILAMENTERLIIFENAGDGLYIYHVGDIEPIRLFSIFKNGGRVDMHSVKRVANLLTIQINIPGKENDFDHIYKEEYTVDLNTFKAFKSKEIIYTEIKENIKSGIYNEFKINELNFSLEGDIAKETTYVKQNIKRGVDFDRSGSESRIINGLQIISKYGNLFILKDNHMDILLKHQNTFTKESSKFAFGYHSPDLSNDNKRVLFIDAEYKNIIKDKNKGKQKSFVFELDLNNMSKKLLFSSPMYLYRPSYSPDCQEVLFEVLSKNCKSDFYIYDIANSITTKIGEWDRAQWIY